MSNLKLLKSNVIQSYYKKNENNNQGIPTDNEITLE